MEDVSRNLQNTPLDSAFLSLKTVSLFEVRILNALSSLAIQSLSPSNDFLWVYLDQGSRKSSSCLPQVLYSVNTVQTYFN